MRVTHQQIADRLGVSRTLVTGALHGTGRFAISEQTRREIERTAREMGYQPRNVTTHAVGLVMATGLLASHIDVAFLITLERSLRERGYRLVLINPDLPAGQEAAEVINSKILDGLLLTQWAGGRFTPLLSPQMPCVVLSEEDDVPPAVEQIGADLQTSVKVVLHHLRAHGHERVAMFIGGTAKPFFARLKAAARRAARELEWAETDFTIDESVPEFTGPRFLELLRGPAAPTAVILSDGEHTISTYCALLGAGYRVPGDVSVISLFDTREYRHLAPHLTATTVGGAAMAERGVQRLLQMIDMPETIPGKTFLAGELIERASVGPVRR